MGVFSFLVGQGPQVTSVKAWGALSPASLAVQETPAGPSPVTLVCSPVLFRTTPQS